MKKLFEIGIGYDDESDSYCAVIHSVPDNKRMAVTDKRLRTVMQKIAHSVRAKSFKDQSFPMFPEDFSRTLFCQPQIAED